MDCIFCKIAAGEIPTKIVYEDELVCGFYDLAPQAPVHILLIPKEHIASLNEVNAANAALVGHIAEVAAKIAREQGFADSGYRLISNCGPDAGQTVAHLHFHILAGMPLTLEMA